MDNRGIISLGFWPTTMSELNVQVISFGYMSSLEPPAAPTLLGKIKRWVTLRRRSRV